MPARPSRCRISSPLYTPWNQRCRRSSSTFSSRPRYPDSRRLRFVRHVSQITRTVGRATSCALMFATTNPPRARWPSDGERNRWRLPIGTPVHTPLCRATSPSRLARPARHHPKKCACRPTSRSTDDRCYCRCRVSTTRPSSTGRPSTVLAQATGCRRTTASSWTIWTPVSP